jgi:hypothetical protein
MKMKLQLLLLFSIIISACNQEVQHKFYYSDGSRIKDSTDIALISEELDNLLQNNQDNDLQINSSLFPKSKFNCSDLLDSLRGAMVNSLIERYPNYKTQIESIIQERILNVGIVVLENNSGKVVGYTSLDSSHDLISKLPLVGTSNKLYGFILAMDKEFHPNDEYVYWEKSNVTYQNGRKDTSKYEIRNSVKRLFSTNESGPIRRYPYQDYSINDWSLVNKALNFNLNFGNYIPNNAVMFESNLFDLTKVFQMLNNQGKYNSSSLVEKVCNSDNKPIYKSSFQSDQLIPNETQLEMEELLQYNMVYGQGGFVKKNLSLDDKHIVYFGQSRDNIDWILCSNQSYSIGIITENQIYFNVGGSRRKLYLNGWHSPRKCMPILKFVLNQLTE